MIIHLLRLDNFSDFQIGKLTLSKEVENDGNLIDVFICTKMVRVPQRLSNNASVQS